MRLSDSTATRGAGRFNVYAGLTVVTAEFPENEEPLR